MNCIFYVILGYLMKYKPGNEKAATSTHEMNRDIAPWFSRDLHPFKWGTMKDSGVFFQKRTLYAVT